MTEFYFHKCMSHGLKSMGFYFEIKNQFTTQVMRSFFTSRFFVRIARLIVKNIPEISCALERDLIKRFVYKLSSKNK